MSNQEASLWNIISMFCSLDNPPDTANCLHSKADPVHKYWTHAPDVSPKWFGTVTSYVAKKKKHVALTFQSYFSRLYLKDQNDSNHDSGMKRMLSIMLASLYVCHVDKNETYLHQNMQKELPS